MSAGLCGARVGITRTVSASQEMAEEVLGRGGTPVVLAALVCEAIPQVSLPSGRKLPSYDGVLFTSVTAVRRGLEQLPAHEWATQRIVVVGRATASALEDAGVPVSWTAVKARAEGILEALDREYVEGLQGSSWLLPRAQDARPVLVEGMAERGAAVDVWPLYRMVPPSDTSQLLSGLRSGLDVITFASGSAVRHLQAALGEHFDTLVMPVPAATIGPVTTSACRDLGLRVEVEASEARVSGILDGLEQWWAKR
ncbi:MAG: uroporphyrinogen-III synthase [Myxococcota bacterium]|nr:uroporphyrinogen-III synthase [Myxococcota bacterium]